MATRRIRTMDNELVHRDQAVTTVHGQVIKLSDAILLREGYFHKTSTDIVEDYFTKQKCYKPTAQAFITGLNEIKKPIWEYCLKVPNTYEKKEDIIISFKSEKLRLSGVCNFKFALENNLVESPRHHLFLDNDSPLLENKKFKYTTFKNSFKFDKNNLVKSTNMGTFSPTFRITEGIKSTFGVELETSIGYVGTCEYFDLNMDCVYDGSLKTDDGGDYGGEYVTGILSGDMGFNQLNMITKVLAKNCSINKKCGVHVHVGIESNKQFIVYLYKLLQDIEKDVFSMMPVSRRDGPHSKKLAKFDFKKLKNIDTLPKNEYDFYINEIHETIYNYILHCDRNRNINNAGKYAKHPLGYKCGYDKNTPRYCWVNFVPALFIRDTYKGKLEEYDSYTIEFRPHPGSLNFVKIKNWTKICLAIINFAENNQKDISKRKISLEEIILSKYPKSGKKLVEYINKRRELFLESDGEKNDLIEKEEIGTKKIKDLI